MDGNKRYRQERERRFSTSKKPKTEQSNPGSTKKTINSNALIFDNGCYSIKIGYSKYDSPKFLPNHIMKAKSERKRCFIADQIEDCRDLSGLYYIMPHEHGYITKFDIQKTIWDYTFQKFPIEDSTVIMTQPILNFKTVQEYMDEIFFEDYNVKALYKGNSTDLSHYEYTNHYKGTDTPCVIIDSGFSFTHVVPYINGKKYLKGIIRMDIGGKLLTNYLKDILSYRQLHVMEETYVINQVKEDTCFMSQDFKADMKRAKSSDEIVKNYVLPDFHNIRRGYVEAAPISTELAENCQILRLNNERISVPEVLVRPSVIPGMEQLGLAQCIAKAISKCPKRYQKALSDNVILTGGNCLFPGFRDRVEAETRMYLPCDDKLSVYQPDKPMTYAWKGGQSLSKSPQLRQYCVTKQEYEENGSLYTYKKFNEFYSEEEKPVSDNRAMKDKRFSYLDHWKNEGIDLFNKSQMTYQPKENDVEFILEGDGIEELNEKYVTIDFEYEKELQEHQFANSVVPIEKVEEPVKVIKKKKVITHFDGIVQNPTVHSSNFEVIDFADKVLQANDATSTTTKIINFVPQLVKASAPKVYKPVFRPKMETKIIETKRAPIITLAGNPVTLNGGSFLVPTSGTSKTVINSRHILNNAVIVPQNLLGKNIKFQLIPFNSEMLQQAGNVIITKKS